MQHYTDREKQADMSVPRTIDSEEITLSTGLKHPIIQKTSVITSFGNITRCNQSSILIIYTSLFSEFQSKQLSKFKEI